MAAKEFIVAIELGSSKMTGIAGQKNQEAGDSTQNRNPSGICRRRRSVHPQRQKRYRQGSAQRKHYYPRHGD